MKKSHYCIIGLLFLLLPVFGQHGGNQEQMLAFADSLQRGIQALYNLNIKGWIVGLQQNTGGNMAPMVARLGPLFSAEKLGSLIDVNGKPNVWHYSKRKYFWDNDTGWSVSNPIILQRQLPVVVLVGERTGSSGEAVVVSFIGNEKTKLFEQPTWGSTTGNSSFKLADGAQIYLTSTIDADKNGKQYTSKITPDFLIEDTQTTEGDAVLSSAIKWVLSQ